MKKLLISILMGVFIAGCGQKANKPQMTPLQIKQIQSKQFEVKYKIAYKAVLSVLQDLGYTVQSTDFDSGVITAESTATSKRDWIFTGNEYQNKHKITASIMETGKYAEVRLNIIESNITSSRRGQNSQNDKIILDPTIYQNAFAKIENAIFIMK